MAKGKIETAWYDIIDMNSEIDKIRKYKVLFNPDYTIDSIKVVQLYNDVLSDNIWYTGEFGDDGSLSYFFSNITEDEIKMSKFISILKVTAKEGGRPQNIDSAPIITFWEKEGTGYRFHVFLNAWGSQDDRVTADLRLYFINKRDWYGLQRTQE